MVTFKAPDTDSDNDSEGSSVTEEVMWSPNEENDSQSIPRPNFNAPASKFSRRVQFDKASTSTNFFDTTLSGTKLSRRRGQYEGGGAWGSKLPTPTRPIRGLPTRSAFPTTQTNVSAGDLPIRSAFGTSSSGSLFGTQPIINPSATQAGSLARTPPRGNPAAPSSRQSKLPIPSGGCLGTRLLGTNSWRGGAPTRGSVIAKEDFGAEASKLNSPPSIEASTGNPPTSSRECRSGTIPLPSCGLFGTQNKGERSQFAPYLKPPRASSVGTRLGGNTFAASSNSGIFNTGYGGSAFKAPNINCSFNNAQRHAELWKWLGLTKYAESLDSDHEFVLIGSDLELLWSPERFHWSPVGCHWTEQPPIPYLLLLKIKGSEIVNEILLDEEAVFDIEESRGLRLLQSLQQPINNCINIGPTKSYALFSKRYTNLQVVEVHSNGKFPPQGDRHYSGIELQFTVTNESQFHADIPVSLWGLTENTKDTQGTHCDYDPISAILEYFTKVQVIENARLRL